MLPSSERDAFRARTCVFVILCALVGLVFYPVLRGELLHWDDDITISQNPNLDGPVSQVFRWSLTDNGYLGRYQPLCWLSWAAIKRCFGLDPFYFHLAVLLLHAVNAGLVFLLIRRLLLLAAQKTETDAGSFSVCAALAAAVWAVHPLRVETTAWAVELVFALPLCFFLLSLLSYLRASEAGGDPARTFYRASLLLFALSLAAYPLVLGGFVVFVALDFFPLRKLSLAPAQWLAKPNLSVWLEKLPFAAIAVFFGWLNWHVRGTVNEEVKPATLAEFGLGSRVMQAFFIWAHNVWKPFVPFHLTPVPAQLVDFKPFAPLFTGSATLVIGLTLLFIFRRRHWPGTFAIWIAYLALLVPVLGLSEHPHYSSDRYSLVVDIGWSILLAGLLRKVWPQVQARTILLAATVVLICGLSCLSRRQIELWQTNVGLFRGMIARLENEPKLDYYRLEFYQRLAAVYNERGDFAAAAETLRTAIRIWPDVIKPYRLLGDTLVKVGDLDGARVSYTAAVQFDPTLTPILNDLGVAYAKAGRYDQAEALFAQVLRQDPAKESALRNMAKTLALHGKPDEAAPYLEKLKNLPRQGQTSLMH